MWLCRGDCLFHRGQTDIYLLSFIRHFSSLIQDSSFFLIQVRMTIISLQVRENLRLRCSNSLLNFLECSLNMYQIVPYIG